MYRGPGLLCVSACMCACRMRQNIAEGDIFLQLVANAV